MKTVFALLLGVQFTTEGAEQIFVANTSAGTIGQYTPLGAVINTALVSGLAGPEGIVVDGDGYIYVADTDANRVGKYTISGAVVNRSLIVGLNSPWALALDGKGRLFVANYGGRTIGIYSTTGELIKAVPLPGFDYQIGIAVNDAGDLFIGNYGIPTTWIGSIAKYKTSGEPVNAPLIPGLKWNWGLACDRNGNLFMAQNLPPGRITEYTAFGEVVNAFNSGLGAPTAIALDGIGNLFIADDWGGVIAEYTTTGAIVNGALIAGLQHPRGVTVGVPPRSVQLSGGDRTAYIGSTTKFTAECAGSAPFSHQWFLNGTNPVSGTTIDSCFELANLQTNDCGAYTVVISNVFGASTSEPVMLNVIPPVEHRTVPGIKLTGEAESVLNLDCASTLTPLPDWSALDTIYLTNAPQFYFDLTDPLPPQRFYRAWQNGTPSAIPSLSLPGMVPAITLTGNLGDNLRLDYINQFGPTDAWVTLDTITLTSASQLYFDVSSIGKPPRLWHIVPVP
jgi:hypothetical protein